MKQTITLMGALLTGLLCSSVSVKAQKCGAIYADDNVVLASLDAKFYRSVDGGASFSVIDPAGEANPEIRCISKVNSTLVIGGINGSRIFRSTDNGATWTVANTGMPTMTGVVIATPSRSLSAGGRVFMGGSNFSRYSDDDGVTWKNLAGVADHTSAINATAGKLWHSSIYGHVSYSSDNGSSWTATATKPYYLGLSGRGFVQFGDTLVALSDKNAGAAVDRSYDYGATWKPAGSLSLGLDMIEISGDLYATSNDGLMKSTDHGLSWTNVCTEFKYYAYGGKMCFHKDVIWIASGNGILRYNLTTGTCGLAATTSIGSAATNDQVTLFPNPANEAVHLRNLQPGAQIVITDITGKVQYNQVAAAAEWHINTSAYGNGIYLLSITTGQATAVRKLVISKP